MSLEMTEKKLAEAFLTPEWVLWFNKPDTLGNDLGTLLLYSYSIDKNQACSHARDPFLLHP